MDECFSDFTGIHLNEMRLIVEGAIAIFECENVKDDPFSMDMIGEALYLLRVHIRDCQKQLKAEVQAEMTENLIHRDQ